MKRLARATIAAVTVLGLGVPGIVGATSSIGTTGPDSTNTIETKEKNKWTVKNNNNLSLDSSAKQTADTGSAKVKDNTTGGDATSGDASNDNTVSAAVDIDNSGSSTPPAGFGSGGTLGGSIDGPTGPDSTNTITETLKNTVKVTNNNNVSISNSVSQSATSGDATVKHNTTGGDATTGDASNTSSSTFELTVTN